MLKKLMITSCTLFLLTACGTDTTEENASSTNQPSTSKNANTADNINTTNESAAKDSSKTDSNNSKTVDITNPTVSMKEAVNIFKKAHPDAEIESVDLDTDWGRLHYDIDGFDSSKEYETEIDATTKEMKENLVEIESNNDESLDFSTIIDPAKAIEIASTKAEVEGLSPTGWSLDADDGKQTYTIEYEKNDADIEIKINATTEEILEVEIDN